MAMGATDSLAGQSPKPRTRYQTSPTENLAVARTVILATVFLLRGNLLANTLLLNTGTSFSRTMLPAIAGQIARRANPARTAASNHSQRHQTKDGMRSRRKKHPNWPYRGLWLAIISTMLVYVGVQTLIGGMTFAKRSTGSDWGLAFVSSLLDATIATWFVAVGASIGSFLNVVAYRLPLGRKIGGHSGCPYCGSSIRARDNIPVLAWVRLRGRCRVCRLPISVQYPLVELGVAIVFFIVYLSEFLSTGGNLPGVRGNSIGVSGLARIADPWLLGLRLTVYLFALSGLIAAALIAVRRRAVPLTLFLWCLVPVSVAAMVDPQVIVIRWREAAADGFVEARLDALTSLLCGAVAGMAVARVLAPLLYRHFDRSLMSSDPATAGARQFCGSMAVAGCLVGWQSVVSMTFVLLMAASLCCWLIGIFVRPKLVSRFARVSDLTVWVWLGLLLFRAMWKPIYGLELLPDSIPVVVRQLLGLLLLAIGTAFFVAVAPAAESESQPSEPDPDSDSDEDWEDDEAQESLNGSTAG